MWVSVLVGSEMGELVGGGSRRRSRYLTLVVLSD